MSSRKMATKTNKSTGHRRQNKQSPETRLSHKLTSILRHGNDDFASRIDDQGWLAISDLMRYSNYISKNNEVDFEMIKRVVENCPKQRFSMARPGFIKANQGHTIFIEDSALETLSSEKIAASYPRIVHGTFKKSIHAILNNPIEGPGTAKGLSRMNRLHVHFSADDQVDGTNVVSGFRQSCDILIYLDISKICSAIDEGKLKFLRSENNVILCGGDEDGIISKEYFEKIKDRKSGKVYRPDDKYDFGLDF